MNLKIKREKYLDKIRKYYDSDLIKVIMGIRRCGKSEILLSIIDELSSNMTNSEHIIYINYEDKKNDSFRSYSELKMFLERKITDNNKYYIFFDEIGYLNDFEEVLASLRMSINCSIFVTGSNSKLLSGELSTKLVGRKKEFTIYPFSFFESLQYLQLNNVRVNPTEYFSDYLKYGGFPKNVSYDLVADKVEYSNELLGDILAKDILRDSKINEADFYKILDYILIHIGKSFSADSIINFYRSNNKTILSKPTIYSYIKKNTQAYLIIPNHRYDVKGKNVLQTLKKYYSVDPIIPLYRSNFNTSNLPFLLENIIFIELLSRGYTVFSGKMTNYEIDFVVFKGIEKCYIQVSYLLSSEDTMKREKRPLLFVGDNCPKYIFSLDAINMTSDGIVHINIIDFLLYKKDITLL